MTDRYLLKPAAAAAEGLNNELWTNTKQQLDEGVKFTSKLYSAKNRAFKKQDGHLRLPSNAFFFYVRHVYVALLIFILHGLSNLNFGNLTYFMN